MGAAHSAVPPVGHSDCQKPVRRPIDNMTDCQDTSPAPHRFWLSMVAALVTLVVFGFLECASWVQSGPRLIHDALVLSFVPVPSLTFLFARNLRLRSVPFPIPILAVLFLLLAELPAAFVSGGEAATFVLVLFTAIALSQYLVWCVVRFVVRPVWTRAMILSDRVDQELHIGRHRCGQHEEATAVSTE